MMSAPNLLGVLERIVRYVRIVNDAALVTVKRDSEGFRLTLQISTGQQPMPWQRFGFDLMAFLSFCRWVTTSDLRPIALELAFAPSADLEPYEDAFKCPVRFNAVANALLFSPSDVRLPLPTAHHVLAEIHGENRCGTSPASGLLADEASRTRRTYSVPFGWRPDACQSR